MKIIALSIVLAVAVAAQTKTSTSQIAVPAVSAPSAVVVLPTGGLAILKLDGFVVDTSTTPPTLKVVAPAPTPTVKITHERLAAPWTIPSGCSLVMVIRNIPQMAGIDYDLTGNVIAWKPVSQPAPEDTVSILCQR